MTKIRVFPHEELCPEGKEIDAESAEILAEVLLQNQIKMIGTLYLTIKKFIMNLI